MQILHDRTAPTPNVVEAASNPDATAPSNSNDIQPAESSEAAHVGGTVPSEAAQIGISGGVGGNLKLAKAVRASPEEVTALVQAEGGFSSCIIAAPRLNPASVLEQVERQVGGRRSYLSVAPDNIKIAIHR